MLSQRLFCWCLGRFARGGNRGLAQMVPAGHFATRTGLWRRRTFFWLKGLVHVPAFAASDLCSSSRQTFPCPILISGPPPVMAHSGFHERNETPPPPEQWKL